MANIDAPFGLRPLKYRSGAPYSGGFNRYAVASNNVALYINDPLVLTGEADVNGVPIVTRATAGTGNPIVGTLVGFERNNNNLDKLYLLANQGGYVHVADDPGLIFEIQADGALTSASVGLNAVLIYTNAGSNFTGESGAELDTGTTTAPATTAAFQLKILRFKQIVDSEVGTNAVLEVLINNHQLNNGTAGI